MLSNQTTVRQIGTSLGPLPSPGRRRVAPYLVDNGHSAGRHFHFRSKTQRGAGRLLHRDDTIHDRNVLPRLNGSDLRNVVADGVRCSYFEHYGKAVPIPWRRPLTRDTRALFSYGRRSGSNVALFESRPSPMWKYLV